MRTVVHHFRETETGRCGHVVEFGFEWVALYQHPAAGETDLGFSRRIAAEAFGQEAANAVDPSFCRIEGDE